MEIKALSKKCLLIALLFLGHQALSQTTRTFQDTTIASTNTYNYNTIHIKGTTRISPASGQSVRFHSLASICNVLATSLSSGQNYIATYTPRVGGITNPSDPTLTTCQMMANIQYFDGLGRPIQTVQVKGSPTFKDVVQPIAYDAYGREATKYLPYSASAGTPGSFQANAVVDQMAFYNPNGISASVTQLPGGLPHIPSPYEQIVFEPSPLNRIVEQGTPGDPWQPNSAGTGHTDKTEYGTNDASSLTAGTGRWAKLYSVILDANGKPSLVDGGVYQPNQLYVTISKDENWQSSDGKAGIKEDYIDKEGRTVLKRSYNTNTDVVSTYFVFDDLGNLTYVLSAKANPDNGNITQAVLDQLCFQYRYDERRRPVEKKIPGKGKELFVYNKLDLSVASQDSIQRLSNQWNFTKYDAFGRVVVSGIWNNNNVPISRQDLQSLVNSQTANWETRDNTNSSSYYYSASSFPTNYISGYLAINYYDDYSFPNLPAGYDQRNSYSPALKGLQTASLANVLGTTNLLWTVNYYDDKGRLTKKIAQHYLNASYDLANYDETSFSYDFTNSDTATVRLHHAAGKPLLTIATNYEFDQVGRETKISQKINSSQKVVLAKFDYNEVGAVRIKHLHGSVGGNTYLQDITQQYNERGWLTKDSSALFVMQLNYNAGTSPMFNGNISSQYWGTANNLNHHYDYIYDKLNRLRSGISDEGYNEQGIDYDQIGNLQHLTRIDPRSSTTSNYTYNYNGNQLSSVTGLTGANPYQYDGNGNVQYDARNQTTNTYNLLNLPNTIIGNGKNLTYVYDAAGNKLRRISNSTGTPASTDYIDGIQYDNGQLSFVLNDYGRALPSGTDFNYEYNIGDKLGNTRVTFDTQSGIARQVQQDDYYPFGVEITRGTTVSPRNLYLYNKMELQDELGVYDYNKRFYDPMIGRFSSIDPLAEKYNYYTPYQFAGNEVPNAMDLDGLEPSHDEQNGRKIAGRDGQLAGPLTNAAGKAAILSNVESGGGVYSSHNPISEVIGILAGAGEAINTLVSGQNADGSKATVLNKVAAVATVASIVPMEGGEGHSPEMASTVKNLATSTAEVVNADAKANGTGRPTMTSAAMDITTGKTATSTSGQPHPVLQEPLASQAPNPSLTNVPACNCAEVKAVNELLLGGSKIEHVIYNTVKTSNGVSKPPCANCTVTLKGATHIP